MTAKLHRDDRMFELAKQSNQKEYQQALLMRWFQEQLVPGQSHYEHHEVVAMIERYLHEREQEVQALEAEKGKSATAIGLRSRLDTNRGEFKSQGGFVAPDLTRADVVHRLSEWQGELKFLSAIATKGFRQK
ncbi:uncharacterized protein MONBRDRAFT_31681 [Monosiga brevicollis MX1]|uniref:Uncharacterized protein n=1 Tax=Monosiga brevicollis TaxID=81824 RepID=A9UV56_MONBE|nr:uncharacterized protein MONBRDRAFT_31681 [Monosiga brevicollis MX1]EDQ91023.1 predicted protein [Monosiga brevicollis MX1]|eukprot:XP_001744320.1 hypothetical protein [Monosiga brevicollis MX1]